MSEELKEITRLCGVIKEKDKEIERLNNIIFEKNNIILKKYDIILKAIENIGSADYETRRAILYRDNYLKMFEEFKNSPYYEAIVKKIKSYQNPVTFYNKIKNLTYGEYLADIKFMYDSKQGVTILKQMAEELGIKTEDYEIEGE